MMSRYVSWILRNLQVRYELPSIEPPNGIRRLSAWNMQKTVTNIPLFQGITPVVPAVLDFDMVLYVLMIRRSMLR